MTFQPNIYIRKYNFFLLGKQLLGLADKIEPGMTKWRGQLLFEMQSATVVLAQRALEEGKLKRFQAQVTYHPYFTSVLSSKYFKCHNLDNVLSWHHDHYKYVLGDI